MGFCPDFSGRKNIFIFFERNSEMLRIHVRRPIVENARSEFIPTRQTLLDRMRGEGDEASWHEFFETYWKLIYNAGRKAGLSDAEAQDVVQETIISVYKSLPNFEYDPKAGSFKAWLLKLTRWRVVDQLRRRRSEGFNRISKGQKANETGQIEASGSEVDIEGIADPSAFVPDSYWDEEWEKNMYEAAVERAKEKVPPKQFQIFDLYVLKEWPVKKVKEVLGVSATQVYLAKHRVTSVLKKEMRAVEKVGPARRKAK
jgi:RNA polymerase sigma factor (sigma-70 family)